MNTDNFRYMFQIKEKVFEHAEVALGATGDKNTVAFIIEVDTFAAGNKPSPIVLPDLKSALDSFTLVCDSIESMHSMKGW